MNLTIGKILNKRYRIICQLGEGGFGKTFLAEDQHLPGQQKCVVKQFKPLASDRPTLEAARRLFDTEAQTLHRLGIHPQIPQLFAYFEESQEFYLVQEYINGIELSQELNSSHFQSEKAVIKLLQEILEILVFVHQEKVIHRDINPRNILRRQEDGKLILIDFGAVKQITTQIIQGKASHQTVAIGTPGYIPSEQAIGRPQLSSDIYAVGMIGLQGLIGYSPNQLPTDSETGEIDWQRLVKVSVGFANVLNKMICYDFRQRYSSAIEALEAVQALMNVNPGDKTIVINQRMNTITNENQYSGKSFPKILQFFLVLVILGIGTGSWFGINHLLMSNNATELYKQGNTLAELKRYKDALQIYEKALKIRPEYEEVWQGKGNALTALNKYKEALIAYEKAIQINPNNWQAWLGRAQVLEKNGKLQEAIETYQDVLKINSNSWEAWQGMANIQIKLEQYGEAIISLDNLLKFQSEDSMIWYQKGWVLQNLKEDKKALEAYEKAINLKIDFSKAWYQKGNILMNQTEYAKAVEAYDKVVQFQPEYSQAWYSRGIALSRLGKNEEALNSYEKAIEAQGNYYYAWYQKGWTLHKLNRYSEAVTAYDQAIRLRPNDYQAWYNKGNALYNLADYQAAANTYQKTVQIKSNYYFAWNSLGNAFFKLKQYQNALNAYTNALRYNSNYPEAKQGKEQVQKLIELDKSRVIW